MENKKPLSPHIQIYTWHISSLVSISHRISGVINIIALSIICLWATSLLFGINFYVLIENFFNSFVGKFFIIGIIWSFNFQILSEIRHFVWDLGYGFELKTSNITGVIVILGSVILTICIYFLSRNLL
tara:strand:- start:3624 stop:4007 length:384 start_codon:yes stop_codon:yes gene_type:complete